MNSLSAFEAGKVDEIIEKTSEATDKGLEGGIGKGSTKVSGNRKRQAAIQEELVRRRTWFSAFESWYDVMRSEDAIGRFDKWDLEVRSELEVGDTLEFTADVQLSPIHLMFATFSSVTVQGVAGAGIHGLPSNSRRKATRGLTPCLRAVET